MSCGMHFCGPKKKNHRFEGSKWLNHFRPQNACNMTISNYIANMLNLRFAFLAGNYNCFFTKESYLNAPTHFLITSLARSTRCSFIYKRLLMALLKLRKIIIYQSSGEAAQLHCWAAFIDILDMNKLFKSIRRALLSENAYRSENRIYTRQKNFPWVVGTHKSITNCKTHEMAWTQWPHKLFLAKRKNRWL